jgi:catechol 2,3-dioxygenase-like lactoylglutathione lyase family enzyme
MSQLSGLGKYNIIGFVSIVDVSRARDFYRDILALRLVMEGPFALVFDANGIMLRLGMAKELPPAYGTVLGWQVPEITATVMNLA